LPQASPKPRRRLRSRIRRWGPSWSAWRRRSSSRRCSLLFKRVHCHPPQSIACQGCNTHSLASYGEGRGLTPWHSAFGGRAWLPAAPARDQGPSGLPRRSCGRLTSAVAVSGWVRASGKGPFREALRSAATEHLTSGSNRRRSLRAVNGYGATPTGDGERVFITV
jgi:hypothetical protein